MNFSTLTPRWTGTLLLCTLALLGSAAQAQSAVAAKPRADIVSSELVAQRVITQPDGREALEAAPTVKPADLLLYTATFKNTGKAPVADVTATVPIPAGTEFVAASAQPAGVLASTDGVRFEAVPLKRRIQQADGRWTEVAVAMSEYRSLRWPARALGAGEHFSASARVRVAHNNKSNAVAMASAVK
jgi:uncharacterized repeat protein (TIGR01451 family)